MDFQYELAALRLFADLEQSEYELTRAQTKSTASFYFGSYINVYYVYNTK